MRLRFVIQIGLRFVLKGGLRCIKPSAQPSPTQSASHEQRPCLSPLGRVWALCDVLKLGRREVRAPLGPSIGLMHRRPPFKTNQAHRSGPQHQNASVDLVATATKNTEDSEQVGKDVVDVEVNRQGR